jgi:hypothetical protein
MWRFGVLGWALALGGCAGSSEVGEACTTPGDTEECVDGAICTNLPGGDAQATGDENQCFALCTDDDQCTDLEGCRGISGTNLKSCQPDEVPESDDSDA